MPIKELNFIFETCERYSFPIEYVGHFGLDDISEQIFGATNRIEKFRKANTVAIELCKEPKKGLLSHKSVDHIFRRIRRVHDIACIELVYTNQTIERYLVDFAGSDINRNQKTYVSDCGNLYIVISKQYQIEDFFPKKLINNKLKVEHRKQKYGVGVKHEVWHRLSDTSLPEFDRPVYLKQEGDQEIIAMRVKDKECGWKFIFKYPGKAIHFPTHWKYIATVNA